MKVRCSADQRERLGILPIRVGEGNVSGIFFNAIVPDIRARSPQQAAELIIDRLGELLQPATGSQAPTPVQHPVAELIVEQIETFDAKRNLIMEALVLYEERIPEEDRYDIEQLVDMVRAHLEGVFGSWKMYFLVATYAGRCVGMMLCYERAHADRNHGPGPVASVRPTKIGDVNNQP